MSVALKRSGTRVSQVLLSGRVQDNLSGGALIGAVTLQLLDRDTGSEYPLSQRVLPNGTFAFYGLPETSFPKLAVQPYHLRLIASATNYQAANIDLDLGANVGQPTLVTRGAIASIPPMQVRLFTGGGLPRRDLVFNLNRNAVRLRGRVVASDNPSSGVSNADLRLLLPPGPSTTADAEGRFEFPDPLPLVLVTEIRISTASGFQPTTVKYEPDYIQPDNFLFVYLKRLS